MLMCKCLDIFSAFYLCLKYINIKRSHSATDQNRENLLVVSVCINETYVRKVESSSRECFNGIVCLQKYYIFLSDFAQNSFLFPFFAIRRFQFDYNFQYFVKPRCFHIVCLCGAVSCGPIKQNEIVFF